MSTSGEPRVTEPRDFSLVLGGPLYQLLWRSRLELVLVPTHPDRSDGLGFLGLVGHAVTAQLLAQGTIPAGTLANRIFYAGAKLPDFKVEMIGLVIVVTACEPWRRRVSRGPLWRAASDPTLP